MSTDQTGGMPPYDEWRPTTDVLATGPEAERPQRRAPWALVAAIGALVLALVGGVTYAVGSLSGGGDQPADALPSGAFALASVDLDPPAGQKVDGFRFLRKFPSLRDRVPLDGDVRKIVFEAIADQVGWGSVDFDRDVSPWLGKRLAVAVYPPTGGKGSAPTAVVALQVTDRDRADKGLAALRNAATANDDSSSLAGWAFSGDYALVTEDAAAAKDFARRAESTSLAHDATFASDTAQVRDGVALAWLDMGAASTSLGPVSMLLGPQTGLLGAASGVSGRTTVVARFDGADAFELVGRVTGSDTAGWATHPVRGMGELPASSALALGISDGKKLVPQAWASMRKSSDANGPSGSSGSSGSDLGELARELDRDYGITVPDDVATLLGDNLVGALDASGDGTIEGGVRVTTDVNAAQGVLDKLEAAARQQGGDVPVVRRAIGDDLVIASTRRQAGRLAADGSLGQVTAFQKALPDLEQADVALWVDPVRLISLLFGSGDGVDKDLEPIDGIGATVHSEGDGATTYRFRLVAH